MYLLINIIICHLLEQRGITHTMLILNWGRQQLMNLTKMLMQQKVQMWELKYGMDVIIIRFVMMIILEIIHQKQLLQILKIIMFLQKIQELQILLDLNMNILMVMIIIMLMQLEMKLNIQLYWIQMTMFRKHQRLVHIISSGIMFNLVLLNHMVIQNNHISIIMDGSLRILM